MKKVFSAVAALAFLGCTTMAMAVPNTSALQTAFDVRTAGGVSSVDVHNDYLADTSDSYWDITASGGSFSALMFEMAAYAPNTSFGIYDTASNNSVKLFAGANTAGDTVTLAINAVAGGYQFTSYNMGGTIAQSVFASQTFGYYINVGNTGDTYYSDTNLNTVDNTDHMLAYAGQNDSFDATLNGVFGIWTPNEYVLAWEDLNATGHCDYDYTDFVVMVESVSPVPEPATMFLFGSGLAGLAGLQRRRKAAKK